MVITSELVSRFYRAPEIILGCSYDTKIDIWSLGCTLYELYTGKILFSGKNNNEMIKLIMQVKGKIPPKIIKRGQFSNNYFNEKSQFLSHEFDNNSRKEYIKEVDVPQNPTKDLLNLLKFSIVNNHDDDKTLICFRDFLDKCLHLDSNKRFSALEALCHPFIEFNPIIK
jgi:serine/threonine-protein kinase PRP4